MSAPDRRISEYMQVFCSWTSSSKNIADSIKIQRIRGQASSARIATTHTPSLSKRLFLTNHLSDENHLGGECIKEKSGTTYPQIHGLNYVNSKVLLDDVVDFERCIQLFANDDSGSAPCTINFKLEKNWMISKVAIASEAKIFELYGPCEEYLGTHHAEYIDTFEDMEVFLTEMDVALANECTLKLAKTKSKTSMWVYGICISVAELNPSTTKPGMDLNKVEERLKMSSQPLTNKAFKCKEFLKMYNSNLPSISQTKVPDPILILKMLEGEFLSSLLSQSESSYGTSPFPLSSLLSKDSNHTTSSERRNSHSSAQESGLCSENEFAMVQTELKYYLDKKILMLENKLTAMINCKLKSMEEQYSSKMDKILNMLEKMNCVPQ